MGSLVRLGLAEPQPVPQDEGLFLELRQGSVPDWTTPGQTRTSWHRWVTLSMLAHAFLAAAIAHERAHTPAPDGLISLTCNEIQHLFT